MRLCVTHLKLATGIAETIIDTQIWLKLRVVSKMQTVITAVIDDIFETLK